MVVILGTLGFHPETLMPTLRSTEDITKVIIFHSEHENSRSGVDEVKDLCELMEVKLISREVPDAFDFMTAAKVMQKEVRGLRANGEDIEVFNIAGGTRIMSACALMVCTLEGVNAVYVHDDTLAEIPLPMLRISYSEVLTDMQKKILAHLLKNRGRNLTQGDLAKELHLHKATVNHHVKNLIEKGAVRLVENNDDAREKIVVAEESMQLLLDI